MYKEKLFSVVCILKNSIVIIKDKYGLLKIKKGKLKNGSYPSIISALNQTEYWENKASAVHNNFYLYTGDLYKGLKDKVKIICPIHGEFTNTRNNHLNGSGCPKCGKERAVLSMIPTGWGLKNWSESAVNSKDFDPFKVYLIRLFDEKESFFKIGRTFRTCKRRFDSTPYDSEVIYLIKSSAHDVFNLENYLKKCNSQFKYKPLKYFQGKDECFNQIDLEHFESFLGLPEYSDNYENEDQYLYNIINK